MSQDRRQVIYIKAVEGLSPFEASFIDWRVSRTTSGHNNQYAWAKTSAAGSAQIQSLLQSIKNGEMDIDEIRAAFSVINPQISIDDPTPVNMSLTEYVLLYGGKIRKQMMHDLGHKIDNRYGEIRTCIPSDEEAWDLPDRNKHCSTWFDRGFALHEAMVQAFNDFPQAKKPINCWLQHPESRWVSWDVDHHEKPARQYIGQEIFGEIKIWHCAPRDLSSLDPALENIIGWDGKDETGFHYQMGLFVHGLMQHMPFMNGTASIVDMTVKALYRMHGFDVGPYDINRRLNWDLEAIFTENADDYAQIYHRMFRSMPVRAVVPEIEMAPGMH